MSEMEPKSVSEKSPFAGCAILVAALLVMVFLIGFSVSVLFRQFNAIAKFTGEEPAPVEIAVIEGREADLNRLAEKIGAFRLAAGGEGSAELALSAEEINLAIAAYADFKDLRGTMKVAEISAERMRIDISFRLNGKPRLAKEGEGGWVTSDPRYLNGILVAEPGLLKNEVVLRISDIEVEGAEVAEEFIAQMSPYRIAERYVGDDRMGAVMPQLTSVSLRDGAIVFEKKAGEIATDTVTDEEVDQASRRLFTFLGIAASLFLFFAAVVIFAGLRLKKRRDAAVSGG
ncbi:hypothetical protein HZ994_14390 [Akkermansiaceae bacterium]|nr:hypothetical protein HZ994_14390 [Akkermansiaceae bacterium]